MSPEREALVDELDDLADKITCYASTITEFPPNGWAKRVHEIAKALRQPEPQRSDEALIEKLDALAGSYSDDRWINASPHTAALLREARDRLRDLAKGRTYMGYVNGKRETLANHLNALESAEREVEKELRHLYPLGYNVRVNLQSGQINPSRGTVIGHPGGRHAEVLVRLDSRKREVRHIAACNIVSAEKP